MRLVPPSLLAVLIGAVPAPSQVPPPRAVLLPPALRLPAGAVPDPEYVCRLIAWDTGRFLESAKASGRLPDALADVAYWRYVSWHGVQEVKPADAERFKTAARWVLNNFHFGVGVEPFREVDGTDGLLWRFDLRSPGWSAAAWSAVARRDGMFTEDAVEHELCEHLRQQAGLKQDRSRHVEVVVWGPWLVREAVESNRSPAGYDLLYSEQRFGAGDGWRTEKRTVTHAGGKYVYPDDSGRAVETGPGTYTVELRFKAAATPAAAGVDFPRDQADWDATFGVGGGRKANAFGREVRTVVGAVVAGMTEDVKNGSFVARQNRLLELEPGRFGGMKARTADVKVASGKKNFIEQAPDFARGVEPQADAFELLATLPAGGLAGLLLNGQKKRVELADGDIARGPPYKRFPHLSHPQVRNPIDCWRCHIGVYGVIEPRNMVKDVLDLKVDLNLKSEADLAQFRGYYDEMRETIAAYRMPHQRLINRVTGAGGKKPWTGTQMVDAVEDLVCWFDSPVSPAQAAAELGVPPVVFRAVAADTLTALPKLLARGQSIGREQWDRDARPEMTRFLNAERNKRAKP